MTLKQRIISIVKTNPGLDDEQIADRIGIVPFRASQILRRMEREGAIGRMQGFNACRTHGANIHRCAGKHRRRKTSVRNSADGK